MRFKHKGFALANGEQGNELVDAVNRMLISFGQQRLPNDTDETTLLERLNGAIDYVEKFKQSAPVTAMSNRLRGQAGQPASRPLSDAQVATRLKARGIDPERFMPKTV